MKRCAQCGRENMDHENFCSSCGSNLNQAATGKVCPSCQASVALDDRFCDNCGASLPETASGGFHSTPPSVPNATRPMAGATPPPVMNQPVQAPVNQPFAQQPVSQQPIGQQPPTMQPGGYPQFNQAPFPGAPQPPKKNNLAIILSISLVLLLGLGAGAYFLFFNKDAKEASTDPIKTTSESNSSATNQTPNTKPAPNSNETDASTTKGKEKPTPPPNNTKPTTNNNEVVAYGFAPSYSGAIEYPLQYYQVLDFDGDRVTELVVGTTSDSSGHVDTLFWNGSSFERFSYFDVPGPIYELNASVYRGGIQGLYIPSSNNKVYVLEEVNGSMIYDTIDMGGQVFSVVDGYYDSDDEPDYAMLTQLPDGTYAIALSPTATQGAQAMKLENYLGNMFLADVDGDYVSDLLYMGSDEDGITNIFFAVWDGTTYEVVGGTTFGESLINYFPGDIDGDGIAEIVTTNYTEYYELEGRVWKWDNQRTEFVLRDIFVIDHPTFYTASPVIGDFTGDGMVDIMMLGTTTDERAEYIIYSR